jgi:hypothetical protein
MICALSEMHRLGLGRSRSVASGTARSADPSCSALGRHKANDAASQRVGSSSIRGIAGGKSAGVCFRPSTHASTMSDHSCIMWRR